MSHLQKIRGFPLAGRQETFFGNAELTCDRAAYGGNLCAPTVCRYLVAQLQRQRFDTFAHLLCESSELGAPFKQCNQRIGLLRRQCLPLFACIRKVFAVASIGVRMNLVAIRLTCLSEQN